MPFLTSIAANAGYGRMPATRQITGVPAYYTSSSGYLMFGAFNSTSAVLKLSSNIGNTTAVRTYTGLPGSVWNIVHDKDQDSNVYWVVPNVAPRTLRSVTFAKGGTTVTTASIGTFSPTSEVLGAAYVPACMWTGTGYGAFIIGGYAQYVIHVLEFNSTKTAIAATYTAPIGSNSEIYGVEVVPSQASGFSRHYGVFYTRNGTNARTIGSFTVNMDTRTWNNVSFSNTFTPGTNGPSNGLGMIYYPPGKPIFTGDTDTSLNRIGMNDTSTATLFVWTMAESGGNKINFTYLKNVAMTNSPASGGYPYHMSSTAYNSVA